MKTIDAEALRRAMFAKVPGLEEAATKEYNDDRTLYFYEVADLINECIDAAPALGPVGPDVRS